MTMSGSPFALEKKKQEIRIKRVRMTIICGTRLTEHLKNKCNRDELFMPFNTADCFKVLVIFDLIFPRSFCFLFEKKTDFWSILGRFICKWVNIVANVNKILQSLNNLTIISLKKNMEIHMKIERIGGTFTAANLSAFKRRLSVCTQMSNEKKSTTNNVNGYQMTNDSHWCGCCCWLLFFGKFTHIFSTIKSISLIVFWLPGNCFNRAMKQCSGFKQHVFVVFVGVISTKYAMCMTGK